MEEGPLQKGIDLIEDPVISKPIFKILRDQQHRRHRVIKGENRSPKIKAESTHSPTSANLTKKKRKKVDQRQKILDTTSTKSNGKFILKMTATWGAECFSIILFIKSYSRSFSL
jgi:hypothetical protein